MLTISRYYHGTTSRYALRDIQNGLYAPQKIEIGRDPEVSTAWAFVHAETYKTLPILISFEDSYLNQPHTTFSVIDSRVLLSGIFDISDLAFLNPFGSKGMQALNEMVRQMPGYNIGKVDKSGHPTFRFSGAAPPYHAQDARPFRMGELPYDLRWALQRA